MDSLPVELVTSIGAFLRYDELSNFSRIAKKYHTILTRLLYDCVFKCDIPAGRADHKKHKCGRYRWPCVQRWYKRHPRIKSWFKCSKLWKSDSIIGAFAARPLDQIAVSAPRGATLLHQYAAHGNTKLVGIFVRKGMHIDTAASSLSLTPLHCTVTGDGKPNTIEYLLSEGADLNAWDSRGRTPLSLAIRCLTFHDIFIAGEAPLGSSAKTNDPDLERERAASKRLEIVHFLLGRGADCVTSDSSGNTPLIYAAASSSLKLCQTMIDATLRKGSNISARSKTGATALHHAIENNQPDNARLLVQNGVNILIADNRGRAPIDLLLSTNFTCCRLSVLELADQFVELGPSRRWRLRFDAQSQMFLALENRSMTRLHILLKFWAAGRIKLDVQRPNGVGPTPLYYICSTGNEQDVELKFASLRILLNAGVTDRAEANNESLHVFISRWSKHDLRRTGYTGYYSVLSQLVDSTSNLNAQDHAGNTALHFAASADNPRTAAIILKKMSIQKLEALRNNNGFTPLHIAAEDASSLDVLRFFLELEMDINSRTNDGQTPLHIAARKCNIMAIELLLARGADFTLEDNEGHTPLHYATIPACAAPLVDAGCERHPNCQWCPGPWWDSFQESQLLGPEQEEQEQATSDSESE